MKNNSQNQIKPVLRVLFDFQKYYVGVNVYCGRGGRRVRVRVFSIVVLVLI